MKLQKIYMYGDNQNDLISRKELKDILSILEEMDIDTKSLFIDENHFKAFEGMNEKEQLKEIKKIIVLKYNTEIRKQIALKLYELEKGQVEKSIQKQMLEDIFENIDNTLNVLCYSIIRVGEYSPENIYQDDCNLFEKLLRLFKSEYKELDMSERLKKYIENSFNIANKKQREVSL